MPPVWMDGWESRPSPSLRALCPQPVGSEGPPSCRKVSPFLTLVWECLRREATTWEGGEDGEDGDLILLTALPSSLPVLPANTPYQVPTTPIHTHSEKIASLEGSMNLWGGHPHLCSQKNLGANPRALSFISWVTPNTLYPSLSFNNLISKRCHKHPFL